MRSPPPLFDRPGREPLAARMRPRTLDEYAGQRHILGPGRLLRRAIQADQLSSVIFHGPPGTGKTTLARVIANSTAAHFASINAVLAGVKDIREAIAAARERQALHGQRTILFVDEVHRFNKAQQDALLPWVENGTVVLIGATTENPYFEVNKALVSRSRVFQLVPLDEEDLRGVARRALEDAERGFGGRGVRLDEEALEHLVQVAAGDARSLLNALELAVETTPPGEDGSVRVTREVAEESIQRRAVLYDKEGDAHFDTISAFIKSVRGSDPDAALYWLAKMVYAGEDPRFLFRRLLILAGEDVGLADPHAMGVVNAAAQAYEWVGMPEGRYMLAHATLYLATAPKSNSSLGFFDALAAVERERAEDVPSHLKDASRDREGFGHGEGYLYPHAYRDHWVAQQYLPHGLQGKVFYQPSAQGFERGIRDAVARRREAQLAAMLEPSDDAPREVLTSAPPDRARDRWLERTLSRVGEQLGRVRDEMVALAGIARHEVVLDARAGTGLLTWEASRHAPEGQVWSLAWRPEDAEALAQQAANLGELARPVVLAGRPAELPGLLASRPDAAGLRFDVVLGRDALGDDEDAAWGALVAALAPGGRLVLAEGLPGEAQRLHELLPDGALPAGLRERVAAAEEAIYDGAGDARFRRRPDELERRANDAGLARVRVVRLPLEREVRITPERLDAWFGAGGGDRPSYAEHLRASLSEEELREVERAFRSLRGRSVRWRTVVALLRGTRPDGDDEQPGRERS